MDGYFLKAYPGSIFRIIFLLALKVLTTVSRSKGKEKKSYAGGTENMFLEMKNELHVVLY